MTTIGELIKLSRVRKKYSLKHLEQITKIKASFIDALERQEWQSLPNFSTTLGFIKSISGFLNINEKTAIALFKRDYSLKKQNINPKPDIIQKFTWSPKLTFALGVSVVILAIFGYLGLQYLRFTSSPELVIETPVDNVSIDGKYIVVSGKTNADAKVTVNKQPVLVDLDGKFVVGLEISPETKEIIITATSRSGKMTEVKRNILVSSP